MSEYSDDLDKQVTLKRPAGGLDSMGRPVGPSDYQSVAGAVNIPCARWPASTRTVQMFQRDGIVVTDEIATETDLGGLAGDIMVIDGVFFYVVGSKNFDNKAYGDAIFITVCTRKKA